MENRHGHDTKNNYYVTIASFTTKNLVAPKDMNRNKTPYAPVTYPGVQPNIYVNGFCFCFYHGEEYCLRCFFDFRPVNNIAIEDDLDNDFDEIISERSSDVGLSLFSVIASLTKCFIGSPIYKCLFQRCRSDLRRGILLEVQKTR